MKTAYYTLYTREDAAMDRASGGEDRLVRLFAGPAPRRSARRENNVISLADYLPTQESGCTPDAEPVCAAQAPVPRARTDHSLSRLIRMEWLACAAMVCVAVAACVAFLV